MIDLDSEFMSACTKLDEAVKIWNNEQRDEYDDAERLYNEAVEIRNKHFK